MRGMFTCGVLDVMMEHNISFDAGAGVSAGAVFGCNFKSRQHGRPVRYNKRFCTDWHYGSIRSLITTGDLYHAEFCYHDLPDRLDVFDRKAFRENPMEFWIAATNVRTGQPEYHLCTDGEELDIEWMRASASIPLASRVVRIGDLELLDGGTADPVPYRFMAEKGYDRKVIILTQPLEFRKKQLCSPILLRLLLPKYPKLAQSLGDRHIRYNELYDFIRSEELAGNAFVLRPPEPLNIGGTVKDPNELERVYQIGRRTAEAQLQALLDYLKP